MRVPRRDAPLGGNAGRRWWTGAVALLPSLLASACDGSASGPGRDGQGTPAAQEGVLALEPDDGLARTVRPGGEVVLRFTRPIQGTTARGAVRVEDETRGRAPVQVEAEARDRDLVLRARGGTGWRPGAVLSVRVAGLPSLSALRAAEGDALPAELRVRVQVRSPRRTDRVPPVMSGSDPADGAVGVDPAAQVLVRFTEAMDVRSFDEGAGTPGRGTIRVLADGEPVPVRAWLDRTRTELTLQPEFPFPPAASVEVVLTDRVRDAGGNPLQAGTPRRISFSTAAVAPGDDAGRTVETFEDRSRLDPLGTTVRWGDPSAPGVLCGAVEAGTLDVGTGGDAALLLDPRGGAFRVLATPAELGDEGRVLKGLLLLAAPGSLPGELLEPAVRVAPMTALLPADPREMDALPWMEATEDLGGATARGSDGSIALPFRHPVPYSGAGSVLVEVSWKGTAGTILLRAARHAEPRCVLSAVDLEPAVLRIAPVLRLESVGNRAAARSLWMDAGAPVSWGEPRVRPVQDPARTTLRFQGAPGLPDGSGPDLARATAWTEDPVLLEGMRWIRFRAHFPAGAPLAAPAVIDEISLPFTRR
jgi:hypothetical protein